ncbi:MAG: ParB/RepB/Spo0J family partition protein [Erysipelotrichaceae bacterium]|nr:ParB/RepB/Spo0J family partition protein [Erysipelotrichaceae bacterium]
MAEKKKLGKGLGAIFGEDVESVLNEINKGEKEIKGERVGIRISEIRPNPYQPRKNFDENALKELADSIKERGVFQPVLVRKSLKGYELIAGERRMKASKMAGLKEIPAVVLDFSDADMMEVSLLENVQREDLSPIEEAEGYNQIIKKLGYTQDELAKKISKSRTYITNILRLLKLPPKVQEMVNKGKLTYGHARALLGINDEDKIIDLANRIVSEGLTVRDIENIVKGKPKKETKPKEKADPYLVNVRRNLEGKLSTRVDVDKKRIVIHYSNTKDLNRILELLNCLDE